MIKELIYLITGQVDKLVALLALHVIAVTVLAVLGSDVLVTCRRLLIDDVFIYKAVSSQTVKTSVDRRLADINTLSSEMIGYFLARKM
jgi:hypothetical protein